MQTKLPYKRGRMAELPPNNIAPLVKSQRQVPVSPYPLRIIGIHDSLTCWTNSNRHFQIWLSRLCYPSDLGKSQHYQNIRWDRINKIIHNIFVKWAPWVLKQSMYNQLANKISPEQSDKWKKKKKVTLMTNKNMKSYVNLAIPIIK